MQLEIKKCILKYVFFEVPSGIFCGISLNGVSLDYTKNVKKRLICIIVI